MVIFWIKVRRNYWDLACTQAVGWLKKPEFIMRSPSWIRAARSGPGWGLTKCARGGGPGEGRKTACPKTSFPWVAQFCGVRRWTLSSDWLADMLSINTRFNIHIPLLSTSISKMASVNVDQAIQSALDFLATRERSVVLKREQKQAIVSLLNGEDVLAVLLSGFGKSMIFKVRNFKVVRCQCL